MWALPLWTSSVTVAVIQTLVIWQIVGCRRLQPSSPTQTSLFSYRVLQLIASPAGLLAVKANKVKESWAGGNKKWRKKKVCVIRCVCFAASVSRQTKLPWQPPASTCGLYSHACCWLDLLVYILLLAHLLPRYLVQPPEGLWLNAQQSSTEQDFGVNPTLTPKQKTPKDYSIQLFFKFIYCVFWEGLRTLQSLFHQQLRVLLSLDSLNVKPL